MKRKNWKLTASKVYRSATRVGIWIGSISVAAITIVVFIDVFGRYLFNKPLLGSYELVEQSMGVLAGFAIMYSAVERGHVSLDLIIRRFSRGIQTVMQRVFSLLGTAVSFLLAYQVYRLAIFDLEHDVKTEMLRLAHAPFAFMLALALFLCGLTLIIQTFGPVLIDETGEIKE